MPRIIPNLRHRHIALEERGQENNADFPPAAPEAAQHPPALALRQQRPGWILQMQEGLRQRGNQALRMAQDAGRRYLRDPQMALNVTYGWSTVSTFLFLASMVYKDLSNSAEKRGQAQQAQAHSEMARFLSSGGLLTLSIGVSLIMGRFAWFLRRAAIDHRQAAQNAHPNIQLQQMYLAGASLNEVVSRIRNYQAGSSSQVTSNFDWARPRLFINAQGEDVTPDFSHWLNRVRDAIENSPQEEAAQMWPIANMFLSKLETEPELRSALANQVKIIDELGNDSGLNGACIDRTAMGFSALMRDLCKDYSADMPPKDFLLRAVHQMIILEADKQITDFMKNENKESTAETYQAIHGSVMKTLRQEIPDLPQDGIENLTFGNELDVKLTNYERSMLTRKIVEGFNTPEKIAGRLLTSTKENAFMEQRYASDLNTIQTEIEKQQEQEYAKLGGNPDELTDEHLQVDVRLDEERKKQISDLYTSIVANASIFNNPV